MSFSETLLPEFDQEIPATRKILERVPEVLFTWKPHEKSMAMGRLASHIAEMPSWAEHIINLPKLEIDPGTKPFNASTSAELLETFDKNVENSRAAIAGVSDEHVAETWELIYGGHILVSMARIKLLRGMFMNHMIHHRGQLSVYLRLHNIAVPGMYGPSADEKF
jgi:uncharacterized damage-inducible protein DinB